MGERGLPRRAAGKTDSESQLLRSFSFPATLCATIRIPWFRATGFVPAASNKPQPAREEDFVAKSTEGKPVTKTNANRRTGTSGIRSDITVIVAVVTFVVGFIIGRATETVKFTPQSRELEVQPVASDSSVSDSEWIADLKRQASDASDNADAWTRLGNAYFDIGRPEAAIEAYEKSLALDPENPDVITDMGIMYRHLGKSERAAELFREAAAIDPSHLMSRFNLGVVLLHDLGRPDDAAAAWREVVTLDPDFQSPTGQPVSEMVKALESDQ